MKCPRWEACRAPYCPLDPSRSETTTHEGEPVCYYLRKTARLGIGEIPVELRDAVEGAVRAIEGGREGGRGVRKMIARERRNAAQVAIA